jgi:hypothetical protein
MNEYPIRLCGLGGLAGGAAIAVPDELRELSEKATAGPWRAHHAAYPNKPVLRIDWRDSCGGGVFTEVATINAGLAEANDNATFLAAAVNFVRSLLASSPPSDMVMVPREEAEHVISAWAFAHNIDGAARNDLLKRLRATASALSIEGDDAA